MSSEKQCSGKNRPYIIGRKKGENRAILFQPDCGQWNCPYCAEKRKNEWFMRAYAGVKDLAAEGLPVGFITLTSRGGKGRTRDAALMAFKVGWPRLSRRVKYAQGRLSYLLVPEQHKNGIIHAHVLANNALSKRWWKDNAYQSGLGYMVDVGSVLDPASGALYVVKYIGKQLELKDWPKGFRRVRASQDWPRLKLSEGSPLMDYEVYSRFGDAMWNVHLLTDAGVVVDILLEPGSEK